VNHGDPEPTINRFLKQGGYQFPVAREESKADLFTMFGVVAFPTNYLIDKDGKIVFRSIGFEEASLMKALSHIGFGESDGEN
jgi:thioredoxin-related protein